MQQIKEPQALGNGKPTYDMNSHLRVIKTKTKRRARASENEKAPLEMHSPLRTDAKHTGAFGNEKPPSAMNSRFTNTRS